MVRNIVVLGLSSHPQLTEIICSHLGLDASKILLGKFAVGETRVEIIESVREKDVFIIQSGGGKVNDHLMELLITISACKTASAKRVTAVLPLFPYSRQSDIPYNKTGAPLVKGPSTTSQNNFTFDSRPATPLPGGMESAGLRAGGAESLQKKLHNLQLNKELNGGKDKDSEGHSSRSNRSNTVTSQPEKDYFEEGGNALTPTVTNGSTTTTDDNNHAQKYKTAKGLNFEPQKGYKLIDLYTTKGPLLSFT